MLSQNDEDYISLTDMLKAKNGDFFIGDWLRNRNTVEFLGIWERVHNPGFNYGEFDTIKSQAGLNSYRICGNCMQLSLRSTRLRMRQDQHNEPVAAADFESV